MMSSERSTIALGSVTTLVPREPLPPIHVPRPLSPFIGRATEIAMLLDRLREPGVRLLTLTGPGGIGKTRLAVAAANDPSLYPDFPYGIFFVPLVALAESAGVPLAVSRVLGIQESDRPLERTIVEYLGHQRVLLVLDNLEQVIDCAGFVAHLLEHCPNVFVLATSRARLHITGEHEFVVPSMDLPMLPEGDEVSPAINEIATCDAVAFFVSRAQSADPAFRLTPQNAKTVASICHQLDGLPLGIELATARLRMFSPEVVLQRLSCRLDLLTRGSVDLAPHQRTMRDTVAWSYVLLSPSEQQLFRQLSVFSGGFSIAAAEGISGGSANSLETLDVLASLVDKSLLRKVADAGGDARLSMLVTIREFGLEQLELQGEANILHEAHASWHFFWVTEAASHLHGSDMQRWLERLDADRANILIAFAWFERTDDRVRFVQLANLLQRYWLTRARYVEGLRWLEQALAFSDIGSDPEAHLECLLGAGWMALRQGDGERTNRYADAALELARRLGEREQIVRALSLAATVARRWNDYERAVVLLEESLEYCRTAGNRIAAAETMRGSGYALMNLDRMDEALSRFREAIDVYEAMDDLHGAALARSMMGLAHYVNADYESARAWSLKTLAVLRRVGDHRAIGICLGHLGLSASHLGDLDGAWTFHREGLAYRREVGDARGFAVWLEAVALQLAFGDEAEAAATLLGTCSVARERARTPLANTERRDTESCMTILHARLSPEAFQQAWQAGRDLSIQDAVDLAVTHADAMIEVRRNVAIPPPSVTHGLTPREEEILRLIARRLSDREIGNELFISPRTASRHVAGILQKLGVHSRREAAAFASQGVAAVCVA